MEEGTPFFHFHMTLQVLFQQPIPLWKWGVLAGLQPLAAGCQHSICFLGFTSVHYVHRCQFRCFDMCFILQAYMFTQEFLSSLCLPSVRCSYQSTFQQRFDHLTVMANGYPAQGISGPIIGPLLVLQSKFKGGQRAYPPMPCGIQVWSGEDIGERVIVRTNDKQRICQILLEVFGDAPLQPENLEL